MFSALKRLNELGTLLSSILIAIISLLALSSFLIPTSLDPASIKASHLHVVLGRDNRGGGGVLQEFALAKFDVVADLTPLFHWNTKQLFVYLVAEYATPRHPHNEVVLWDRIVDTRRKARLNINGAKPKYKWKEIGGTFKNVNATFSLRYDVQPWAGPLMSGEVVRSETVALPALQRSA